VKVPQHGLVRSKGTGRRRSTAIDAHRSQRKRPVPGLTRAALHRARISKDARFDGKFFIAVLATGVYRSRLDFPRRASQCGESCHFVQRYPATRPCASTAVAYVFQIGSDEDGT
jgi:hypothetical protein